VEEQFVEENRKPTIPLSNMKAEILFGSGRCEVGFAEFQ